MRIAKYLFLTVLLAGCFGNSGPLEGSEREYPRQHVVGFSVDAKMIQVKTEEVYLFDYDSDEDTEEDLRPLSADGRRMGQVELPWSDAEAVHIFATGRQIAVYPGSTKEVIDLLMQEGGEQVVGDPLPER